MRVESMNFDVNATDKALAQTPTVSVGDSEDQTTKRFEETRDGWRVVDQLASSGARESFTEQRNGSGGRDAVSGGRDAVGLAVDGPAAGLVWWGDES